MIQACKTGLDSNPQVVKDAEAELNEIERQMDAQSRRYANLADEHREIASKERYLAHRINDIRKIIMDAKL